MDTNKSSSNAKTIFGITNIPSDNHIRNILDKIILRKGCFMHPKFSLNQIS